MKCAWLKQRAQANTRAWALDEAGYLFGDLKKDYMAAMLGLLLKLYDAPPDVSRETITHGMNLIKTPLLSFFGATTPKSMEDHLRNEKLWDEGLWSRFALISPDSDPQYATFAETLTIPASLIHGLQQLDRRFPKPEASFKEKQDDGSVKADYIEVYDLPPLVVTLSRATRRLWAIYDRAMRYDIPNQGLDETLYASYTRFPSQALKVAMMLAAIDSPDQDMVIEDRHLLRAIRIVEGWRHNLHRLWRDGMQSSETKLGSRLLAILREMALSGATVRELQQRTGKTAKEIKEVLDVLRLAGQVDVIDLKGGNGRMMQKWKIVRGE